MDADVRALIERICHENPRQRAFLEDSLSGMTPEEHAGLQSCVSLYTRQGCGLEQQAASYLQIVNDTLKEQMYFKRHGRYRHASLKDVIDLVYNAPKYMRGYMVGLALTGFLWPNHRMIMRYFAESVAAAPGGGRYLEVGPGHGFFLMTALRSGKFVAAEGVDFSATSLELTRSLLESGEFGAFSGYRLHQQDVFEWQPSARFDFIVMGEVLEHVENPEAVLAKLRGLSAPQASLFVTTCINSPAIDHIYLYRNFGELRAQVERAGLKILDHLLIPYAGTTLGRSESEALPINVAMRLGL